MVYVAPDNLRIVVYGCTGSRDNYPSLREIRDFQRMIERNRLRDFVQTLSHTRGTLEDTLGGPIDDATIDATLDAYIKNREVPMPTVYGGMTTCILVETADGDEIMLDMGSGAQICGKQLLQKWNAVKGKNETRTLYLLGSHSHADHVGGFEQNPLWFDKRVHCKVFGNKQFLASIDLDHGVLSHELDVKRAGLRTPLNYKMLPATFGFEEIGNGTTLEFGNTRVTALEAEHPAPCLMYVIERNGKKFVFATDHERYPDGVVAPEKVAASVALEDALVAASQGADLIYRDAQYTEEEYLGRAGISGGPGVPRIGWGHSTIEQAVKSAQAAGAKKLLIGHHDPNRAYPDTLQHDKRIQQQYAGILDVRLAKTGDIAEL